MQIYRLQYYLNRDYTLTIFTYDTVSNVLMPLVNGHWYRLVATYKSLSAAPGDLFYARAEIFDLGINGLSIPATIGNNTIVHHDINLVNSPEFNIKICGARWGGGEYLDNFTFHGIPGSSNCVTTGATENVFNSQSISIYPQTAHEVVHFAMNIAKKVESVFYTVTDIAGREVMKGKQLLNDGFSLNVGRLTAGIYLLQLQTGSGIISKRISVN